MIHRPFPQFIRRLSWVVPLVATLATAPLLAAPLTDGQFAQGLTYWQSAGDVSAGAVAPAELPAATSPWALLGTASVSFEDDAPAMAGAANLTGNAPLAAGGPLESPLGLLPGSLDRPDLTRWTYEGSVLWQTFDAQAGDTVSVHWNVFTRALATAQPGDVADTAWMIWNEAGQTQWLALGDTSAGPWTQDGTTPWWQHGWQTTMLTVQSSGPVVLGFAIADVNSFETTSVLAIDSVVQTSAVSEPESIALVMAGWLVVASRLRRRHRARASDAR